MFNLLMTLVIGVIIGWNFHSFFTLLTPTPPVLSTAEVKVSKTSDVPEEKCVKSSTKIFKITSQEISPKVMPLPLTLKKEENISIPSIESKDKSDFYNYLENNLFTEAMSLYVDASDLMLSTYEVTLFKYFENKIKSKPQKALEEMMELQEIEKEERKIDINQLNELEEDNYLKKSQLFLKLIREKIEENQKRRRLLNSLS